MIDRSQNLHDWRINLSAIEVSVEFHLKGRTLLFASSLYPGNFYIIRTFLSLSLSHLFPSSFIDILHLFVPALGSIVLRFVLLSVIAFIAKLSSSLEIIFLEIWIHLFLSFFELRLF